MEFNTSSEKTRELVGFREGIRVCVGSLKASL